MKCVLENTFVLAEEVEMARTFFKRLKGLMFRPSMQEGTAMLLSPCPQIHTCFMKFPIDVLFLAEDGTVLYVMENLRPWRISPIIGHAVQTLEMPAGTLKGRVKVGHKVDFQ
ncbi:MAG: DUF192 domain-containing protein [Elusimicrobiaceae bacterium]|nr:DUF192 domain-containing protein [Elusimicrobiaceae bacterium]